MGILNTPGGYLGRNSFDTDPTKHYPIDPADFKDTFEKLYPKRPNFNEYTECSSRGTCDYATGECKCFDGFEGRGRRRTSCPSGCSGHGRCLNNYDINKAQYYSFNYPNDQMWDQMRTQSCKCDRGYTGYDCNSRICPFGDDPTSDCGENSAGDVQLVVTRSLANPTGKVALRRFFTLTFTDMFGGKFTTRPILDHADSCKQKVADDAHTPCPEIQYALMDLPNFAIPEVEVDTVLNKKDTGTGDAQKQTTLYTVQFTDSSNSGKQNTLECNLITTTTVDGAQPKYNGVEECQVYNVGGPEWFGDSGEPRNLNIKSKFTLMATDLTRPKMLGASNKASSKTTYEDFQPCSSKGDCDAATGTCTCNSGHYGEACEKQSTYY